MASSRFGLNFAVSVLLNGIVSGVFSTEVLADALTWKAAIDEAAQKNQDILRAKYQVNQAEEQIKVAQAGLLPQLSADATARTINNGAFINSSSGNSITINDNNGGSNTFSRNSGGGATNIASATLGLTQNIYSGGKIPALVREREAALTGSLATVQDVRSIVSNQLSAAGAGLIASQRLVELSDQFIKRLDENLKIVELRFENGNENKGSFLFAQASLEQSKFDQLQAQNGIKQAQQEFSRVLGRDGLEPVVLVGDIDQRNLPKESELKGLAENTPAAKVAKAAREAASERVAQARAAFRPNIGATGSAGYQEREGSDNDSDTWSAGINLTYPLFTGGRNTAALAAADADFMAAQSQYVAAVSSANSSLRSAYNRFMESIRKIEVDRSFVEAAQVRADIARSRYNNGLLIFEDWDIIEKDLINRKRSLVESQRQRVLAEAAFYQIVGQPLFK